MCREFEALKEEGREEGRKEGREEERYSTAQRMLRLGKFALDEIVQISNLPLEEVQRMAAELAR